MKKRLILLTFAWAYSGGTSLWAHHSLAAEFDQKKPVSLTGTLTKLDWRNPHAWIYMDVKNASGDHREMGMRTGLAQRHDARGLYAGIGEGWR